MSEDLHVFRLQPMPGVPEGAKVSLSSDDLLLFIVLPDDSQIIITADRAVYVRGREAFLLTQWQWVAAWATANAPLPPASREPGTFSPDGSRAVPYLP